MGSYWEGGRQNTVPDEGVKCQGEPWAVVAWCGQPAVGRGGLWWSLGEGEVVAVLWWTGENDKR